MIALSVQQPWATLIAIGAKSVETRDWSTRHRGWLAIHASKRWERDYLDLATVDPFRSAIIRGGYERLRELPLGAIVAVVDVVGCVSTDEWEPDPDSDEYTFGDYTVDRWAWRFANIRRLPEPILCRGALGLWRVPDDVAARVGQQLQGVPS